MNETYDQDRDFDWFYKHIDQLYAKYGDKYAIIRNKKVLNVYDSSRKAIIETMKTLPLGQFICMNCDAKKNVTVVYTPGFII